MIDLSISIVSWNVKALLEKCLESIFREKGELNIEVIVVDNNSADGSADLIKGRFPEVRLIENKSNLGYAAANNQAIKLSKGKYVLLLNPDTEIRPDAFQKMIDFMGKHADAGALGPKLLNKDGSIQPSCMSFPTLKTALFNALFLDALFPKSKLFGKYLMSWWDHNDTKEVDQPMGAALLIRKDVIDRIGLMDEHNIFWFDEVDYCFEIKKAGFKIYFFPGAEIIHYKGESFKQWKSLVQVLRTTLIWRASRNYFFKKRYGWQTVPVLILFDIIQVLLILGILMAIGAGILFFINLFRG